jgi:hypothetical protein
VMLLLLSFEYKKIEKKKKAMKEKKID